MANEIDKVATPALPLATEEYSRPYMDQNSNVLRLFFNRFVNSLNTLLSTDTGGKFLYMPYGVFYSTAAQPAAVINTGYAVTFNTTRASSAISVVSSSRITATNSGLYHVTATLQFAATGASTKTISVWLKKNGTDEAYSAHEYVIRGSGTKDIANWSSSVALTAGDYVEVFWATTSVNAEINARAAASPRPAIPSASIDIAFVSNV